jgi:hypothetical protein
MRKKKDGEREKEEGGRKKKEEKVSPINGSIQRQRLRQRNLSSRESRKKKAQSLVLG